MPPVLIPDTYFPTPCTFVQYLRTRRSSGIVSYTNQLYSYKAGFYTNCMGTSIPRACLHIAMVHMFGNHYIVAYVDVFDLFVLFCIRCVPASDCTFPVIRQHPFRQRCDHSETLQSFIGCFIFKYNCYWYVPRPHAENLLISAAKSVSVQELQPENIGCCL